MRKLELRSFNFGRAVGRQGPIWPQPRIGGQPLAISQITLQSLAQLLRTGQPLPIPVLNQARYSEVERDLDRFPRHDLR